MLRNFRFGLITAITFSLGIFINSPTSAEETQIDYCRQAQPTAYLTVSEMVRSAKGIYLLQADRDRPADRKENETLESSSEDSNTRETAPEERSDNSPTLPNFKTEIKRISQGRKNPDRITISPSTHFRTTQTFTVLETLIGDEKSNHSMSFSPSTGNNQSSSVQDFNSHKNEIFWDDQTKGRVSLNQHCQLDLSFTPGKTYLVFEGLFHPKGAELIQSQDDKWLAHIRHLIQEMNSEK